MFCPNCGKECGNANFCSHCGNKLANAAAQTSAWSVGTPCPHCGGTKLEGNNCAFCGAQLLFESKNQYMDIPLGLYDGESIGSLVLEESAITIRHWAVFKEAECRIPYDQIVEVRYIRGHKKCVGFLVVRWYGNRDLPIPMTYSLCSDHTTVPFSYRFNEDFYKVYCFLQSRAPKSARFSMYNAIE